MRWTTIELDELEVVHNRVGSPAPGANRYAAVEAVILLLKYLNLLHVVRVVRCEFQ